MTNSGTVSVDSGSLNLSLRSGLTHLTGSVVTGSGTVSFFSHHILLGSTTFSAATMTMGLITGPGALTIGGRMNWPAGTVSGSGAITISPPGLLSLGVSFGRTLSRPMSNLGVIEISAGSLLLSDGTLTNMVGGVVNVSGNGSISGGGATNQINNSGTLNSSGSFTVYVPLSNSGTVRVTNGSLSLAGGVTELSGTTLAGGDWNVGPQGALHIGPGLSITTIGPAASVTLNGPGALLPKIDNVAINQGNFTIINGRNFTLVGALSNSGHVVIGSGSAMKVLNSLNNTGSVEIGGAMIVDYTGGTPLSALAGQIGSQILPSDPSMRIGYAEASALGVNTFSGLSVDSTSALLKLTFAGDTNLDGIVDITDLGNLASHWQASATWLGGDFDYNNFVDITDLGLLATNWQAGVSINDALAAIGLGGASVPEPVTFGLPGTCVAGMIARRRRRSA